MIKGMDKFRQHFESFSDRYVLIGGAASELVMAEAGVDFRATKDLDIVLCLEALDKDFVDAFWAFIKAGGYQNQQRSTGKKIFYRFNHPEDNDFPFMLELFSRAPDLLAPGNDSHLTPISIDEDVSSLSAILLNEDYYQFLHDHKHEIDGVTVVDVVALIPLKARAWLDLTARQQAGEEIDAKDIKKHKNDVFRLFQIISPNLRIQLPESIAHDLQNYLAALLNGPQQSLKTFGLKGLTVDDVVNTLRHIYGLGR